MAISLWPERSALGLVALASEALPSHQSRAIQRSAVHRDLRWETMKCVAIGLDFVAMQDAVHDSDIDSILATAEPEFIDDHGIRMRRMFSLKLCAQQLPKLCVIGGAPGDCPSNMSIDSERTSTRIMAFDE